MLRRIPKGLLLVALLAAFGASMAPAFGRSHTCRCYHSGDRPLLPPPGGCHFDQTALQCVNTSCTGSCFYSLLLACGQGFTNLASTALGARPLEVVRLVLGQGV